MPLSLPNISILIPMLNEQGFITECLNSILKGNYPNDKIEILVIDGGSTDNSRQEVRKLSNTYQNIRLLENPKKIVPTAMNIGIGQANYDIIVWLGAHATYDCDYLNNSVKILLEEKCASVGGVITPKGKSFIGRCIAIATTSTFGIGNAKYRHANRRQEVDTVFAGCWMKENILNIGGFNESLVRNQDYELNYRLRKKVGPILLDPSIRCTYYCRETIQSLAKQYFQYGYWRFNTIKKHPRSFNLRQAAPITLLLGLLLSICLGLLGSKLAIIVPTSYIIMVIIFTVSTTLKEKRPNLLVLLPVIFITIHLSWAFGFSKNLMTSQLKSVKT